MPVRTGHALARSVIVVGFIFVAGTVALSQRAGLDSTEQLGKALFFDAISEPGAMSCATCHAPATGWTGPVARINLRGAVLPGAVHTRFGNRKPPSAAYAPFAPIFHYDADRGEFVGGNFWNGRATGERLGNPSAEQALGPWLNPVEHNMETRQAVCLHVAASEYAALFERVWGEGSLDCSAEGVDATYDNFGRSIAAYEGSAEVSPFNSRFDAYWRACLGAGQTPDACGFGAGEKAALDPDGILDDREWQGLITFGEHCSTCHDSTAGTESRPPLFTSFRFYNLGVPRNPLNPYYEMDEEYLDDGTPINPEGELWVDLGLGGFLATRTEYSHLAPANEGKQRTPTVRNVDSRPGKGFPKAYMHNGALKSLEEVVRFLNTRDVTSAGWPPPEVDRNVTHDLSGGAPIGNLGLDRQAVDAIVAFLKTLSDAAVLPPSRAPGARMQPGRRR